MFMFYKIKDDYYVLVGNKYMQVKFKVDGEEINSVPTGEFLERNSSVKAEECPFNEDFKKQITRNGKLGRDETQNLSHFGRDR